MVESCPIAEWSHIQMPFECRTKFSLVFRPAIWKPDQYSNGGLNTDLPFEYQTSEYWTSESLLFRCFRYSDPHCTYHISMTWHIFGFSFQITSWTSWLVPWWRRAFHVNKRVTFYEENSGTRPALQSCPSNWKFAESRTSMSLESEESDSRETPGKNLIFNKCYSIQSQYSGDLKYGRVQIRNCAK